MGLFTLADFREELTAVMGSRGTSNNRIDRWINMAYFELSGALDFPELNDIHEFDTSAGDAAYAVPSGTRLVKTIVDNDESESLTYIDPTEYFRLDRTLDGPPIRWTRYGNEVFLHPTPDGTIAMLMLRKMDPVRLAQVAHTTVLSATWDAAVHMLSVYQGLLSVGENEQRAGAWLMRAVAYIQTRATEAEMFTTESGLGLSYSLPMEKRFAIMNEAARAGG